MKYDYQQPSCVTYKTKNLLKERSKITKYFLQKIVKVIVKK